MQIQQSTLTPWHPASTATATQSSILPSKDAQDCLSSTHSRGVSSTGIHSKDHFSPPAPLFGHSPGEGRGGDSTIQYFRNTSPSSLARASIKLNIHRQDHCGLNSVLKDVLLSERKKRR